MNDIITQDGEVIESTSVVDPSLAIGLTRAEIDTQIATARSYPRSIQRATGNILTLATMDEATAEECNYALPRGNKPIQGPSIRLAEIIQQCWGNCRVAARVVHVDRVEKYLEAEGVYHDLETNSATMARVRRSIAGKGGRVYSDDMIIITGNAACSIAKRNAILAGVPKSVWRQAYDAARQVVAGTVETLVVRREKAITAFANFGVKPEQVFAALGVGGVDDVNLDHIPILRGMFSAIKNGEATVEEVFSAKGAGGPTHQVVTNPLADEPAPEKDAGASTAPASEAAAAPADSPEPAIKAEPAAADPKPASEPRQPRGGHTRNSPAFEEGAKAARDGVSRKNPPLKLRGKDAAAGLAAWLAGYDSVKGGE
jgi:hypothetical protein